MIPAYHSTRHQPAVTEGVLLLSSTSVLSSPLSLCLKTQESSISLTYIIYIFSLFHPFTALHNCLMGWDTFFVLPLDGPFSTLKLSHRNWRKGWSGWMFLNFFLIGVLRSVVCHVTWQTTDHNFFFWLKTTVIHLFGPMVSQLLFIYLFIFIYSLTLYLSL